MSNLIPKKQRDAINSAERDRHLLTDKAATERILEAVPENQREAERRAQKWFMRLRNRKLP